MKTKPTNLFRNALFLTILLLLCSSGVFATTYTVTNTNNSGSGSLRQAIDDANANAGADIIKFNIAASGVQTISLTSSMDSITGPVTIDGTTEGGYSGTPLIYLDGTSAGTSAVAIPLNLGCTNSVVKGLAIGNFQNFAIYVEASGVTITNCYIGTDASGSSSRPNGVAIYCIEDHLTVGGATASLRNVISGNSFYGLELVSNAANVLAENNYIGVDASGSAGLSNGGDGIFSSCANNSILNNVVSGATGGEGINLSLGADNTIVQGNFVGTNATGTAAIGNNNTAIYIHGAKNVLVGGTTAAERNILSGNKNFGGIEMASGSGNTIEGNYIGLNAAGTAAIGNLVSGITHDGATGSIIKNNVISGNSGTNGYGINITAGSATITNNYIGLDATGTTAIPNAQYGLRIATTTASTIGGTGAGSRNYISGNTKGGLLQTAGSSHIIENNYIGLNVSGTAVANAADGVDITGSNCIFGNAVSGGINYICGNTSHGVGISSTGDEVINCYIGINPAGTAAIANGGSGINITGSATTIGGTTANTGNVISGNTGNGIIISGSSNAVHGNIIGLNAAGTGAVANGSAGISVTGGTGTVIGGGSATANRNFISGNTGAGVSISGTATPKIQNNYIGTDITGATAIANANGVVTSGTGAAIIGSDLDGSNDAAEANIIAGNTTYGISMTGSNAKVYGNNIGLNASGSVLANGTGIDITGSNNTVGSLTSTANEANTISGNTNQGVYIQTAAATANTVQGNYIGVNTAGTAAIANGGSGVRIDDGENNTIGGAASASGNIISGNSQYGVVTFTTSSGTGTGNTVANNYIGTNVAGTAAIKNNFGGVALNAGSNIVKGNLVSGNASFGIEITNCNSNIIKGNQIGVNAAGTSALPNSGGPDVLIQGSSASNLIGGTSAADRNIISGSGSLAGIALNSGSNIIEGNYIGTDINGTASIPNTIGISVGFGANSNIIGAANAGNIIAGNTGDGIKLNNSSSNKIVGNHMGVDATGTTALANSGSNIDLISSSTDTIGSTATGGANILSGNSGGTAGIEFGSGSNNNVLTGNYIGLNAAGTSALPNSTHPGVLIDGATGTVLTSNIISGNNSDGIKITANSATIKGNYIGLNAAGTGSLANNGDGIDLTSTAGGSTIGGTNSGDGNVVSGNSNDGIFIGSTGNTIAGNMIGLNAAGSAANGNGFYGIEDNKGGNTIGGSTASARNVISGNTDHGIEITGSAGTADLIQNNYIGTDVAGSTALGNGIQGIDMNSAGHSVIGNVISGNHINGFVLQTGTNSAIVKGNYVGTNAAGTAALPNTDYGIVVGTTANNNTIGGTAAGQGNLISGNALGGMLLTGASNTTIIGNMIGTDINGTNAIANGVGIKVNSSGSTVIGNATGGGNVISGNTGDGINTNSALTAKGNLIGLNLAGTGGLANGGNGINITSGSSTIGGSGAGDGNFISGNALDGIILTAGGNTVEDNYIGTNVTGTSAIANTGDGIDLQSSSNNILNNIVSGNTAIGIHLSIGGTSNTVQGNIVGLNATGNAAIPNHNSGIWDDAGNNTIGGNSATDRNIASGNTNYGIVVNTAAASGSTIQNNFIGTDGTGTTALPNGKDGVQLRRTGNTLLDNTISDNTLNGVTVSAGSNSIVTNTITNNAGTGVVVTSGTSNLISQNIITGNGFGIDLGNDGLTLNDASGHSGPNNYQNFPVITNVVSSGGNTTITGSLSSTPASNFTIEFYGNTAADASGYGQGKTYIGSTTVSTNGSGNATFNSTFAGTFAFISATATDASNNTSEFGKVPAPTIAVLTGNTLIANNNASPIFSDSTNIGTTITRTYKIKNIGSGGLNVTLGSIASGFSANGLPVVIGGGDSSNVTVTLQATTNGVYAGNLVLSSNDGATPTFTIPLSGWVGCWNVQYVDPTGFDTLTGSSSNLARKTVQAAVNAICNSGTIYLRPGSTFNESVNSKGKNIDFAFTSASSTPTTVADLNINGVGSVVTLSAPLTVTGTLTFTNGILQTSTADPLILSGNGATCSGGNTTSYIDGPVQFSIFGTQVRTTTLPLGKGSVYRPISLYTDITDGASAGNTFQAQMFNTDPHTLGLTLPNHENLSYTRYYQVDHTVINGTVNAAQIILPFINDATNDSIKDLSNVFVMKGNGSGGWTDLKGSASGSLSGSYYDGTITSGVFSTFSPFALATGCGSNPQPSVDFSFSNSCVGNSVTFTNNTTVTTGNMVQYIWDFGDGSSQVVESGTYPPNPSVSHTYSTAGTFSVNLEATSNLGCQVVLTKYITINPLPNATITGAPEVCAGSAATFVVNISNVGSTDGWGLTYTQGATTQSLAGNGPGNFNLVTTSLAASTTITLVSIQNTTSGCSQTVAGQIAGVTIDPASVGGSVSGSATVCSGSNNGTLALSGNTGAIVKWQYSTDGGTTWFDIANTTASQAYTNLSTTTQYRAVVQSGVCATANSSASTITVNPLPTATIGGSTTICSGSTASLTVTVANTGGANWSLGYLEGSNAKTLTGTGNGSFTLTTSTLTTATSYELQSISLTSGSPTCANTTLTGVTTATVSVNPLPSATIGTGSTICNGSTATITVTISDVASTDAWKLNYTEGVTAKNITGTGPGDFTITTASLAANTTVTLTSIQNTTTTCSQIVSGSATIIVSPASVGGTVSGAATVCSGSNGGTLTLSGNTGSVVKWQYSTNAGATWFDIANTTTSQTYTNLTITSQYRAVVQSGVCATANSSVVTVTVNALPTATIGGSTTICSGSTASLTVTVANTGGANWTVGYLEGSNAKTLTGTGNGSFTLTTSTLTTATSYELQSISLTSGSPTCANTTLTGVTTATVSVNPLPSATIGAGSTVCNGSTATIAVNVSDVASTDAWKLSYNEGATAKSITGTGPGSYTITTASLAANTTVTLTSIQNTSTTCSQVVSGSTTITVSPTSVGGTVAGAATVCNGTNSGTLTLSGNTGAIAGWQYSTDGVNWINIANTTTSQTYTNLSITTQYRAVVQSGVCASANSSAATVTVNALPTATISVGSPVCQTTAGTLNITVSNVGAAQTWSISYLEGSNTKTLTGTGSGSFFFTTSLLNTTTTYELLSITETSGSPACTNSKLTGTTVGTITVYPGPSFTLSGTSQTICSGSAPSFYVTITNVPYGDSWTLSYNEGVTPKTLSGTGSGTFAMNPSTLTAPSSFSTTVTYTITNIVNTTHTPACGYAGTLATFVVTVLPSTVGGTISSSTTSCGTVNSGTLSLGSNVGSVVRWEYSTDGGTTWNTIANTTTSQSYLNLATTTIYRALVQSGVCSALYSGTATITVNPQPTASIGGTQTICTGSTPSITVTVSNVPSGQGWSLSYKEGATSKTLTGTGSGSFTLNASALTNSGSTQTSVVYTLSSITNTTTSCASAALTTTYTVNIDPSAAGGTLSASVAAVCNGTNTGTISLSGNVGTIVRWEYTTDGGATWIYINNTTTSQAFDNLTATTSYRVRIQSGTCGTAYSTQQTITVNPLPTATIAGNASVCTGSTSVVTFTVSNVASTDKWTINYTINSVAATLSGTGPGINNVTTPAMTYPPLNVVYSLVSITNNTSSCASNISGTATIMVNPKPTAAFSENDECFGTAISFVNKSTLANGHITGNAWSFGDGNTSTDLNPEYTYASAGGYSVKLVVTSDNGCKDSVTKTATVFPKPVASFTAPNVCAYDSAAFASSSTVSSGKITGYNWQMGDNSNSSAASFRHKYAYTGTFDVNLTVTTDKGCTANASSQITIYPKPTASFMAQPVCGYDSMPFMNNSNIPYGTLTYNWTFEPGATSTAANPKYKFSASGNFNVRLLATSNYGCRDSVFNTVTVNPVPVAAFTYADVCIGKENVFTNTTTVSNGGTVQDENWDFGDSSYSTGENVRHTYSRFGSYKVLLTVHSDKGCMDTVSHEVTVHPLPNATITSAGPLQVCAGGSVTLSAPAGMTGYQWSTGATTQSITVTTSGTYIVVVSDKYGCSSVDSIHVIVWPLPIVSAGNDTSVSKGFSVQLHGSGGVNYSWAPPGSLDNPNSQDPIATPLQTTTYTLTATDVHGCAATSTVTITVIDDYKLITYNTITPNGDGKNDTWVIDNISTYPATVMVFNRYGQQIYTSDAYKNDWDGTFNGKQLPEGTYYYVITFKDNAKVYKGAINILRNE